MASDPGALPKPCRVPTLGAALLGMCMGCAGAAERNWYLDPGVSLSETYSDEVAPDSPGFDESDFITQLTPRLKAGLNGRRVQAELDYQMQNILYARNNRASTYHQYLARANAELLPEHLFLDTSSTLTQRFVNSAGVRTNNNYTLTGNRTNQLTAGLRPSWHQPLGDYAEALLGLEHGIVRFDDSKVQGSASDSRLNAASLTLNSLAQARRLSWQVDADLQHINYDDNAFDNITLRRAGALLGYRIIPSLSPLVLLGYEDNDFGARLSSTSPKDPFWALGLRWQPNPRMELEALAGHRFFGNTYRLNWRQRGRHITTELGYTEEVGGETAFILDRVSLIDNPGQYPQFALGLTNQVFLRKRAQASARFERSKTAITLTPFFERREFEESAQDDRIGGIDANWEWAFAARSTFSLRLHWDHIDQGQGAANQTFRYATVGVQRELGPATTAALEYAYTDADSDDKQVAYTENAVTATLTHWFGTRARKTPGGAGPVQRRARSQSRRNSP